MRGAHETWFAALLFVLGSASVVAYRQYRSYVPISASPARIDFGNVPEGKNSRASVRLTNNSDQDLILAKPETSCRCTTAKMPSTIPAHKSATIEIQLAGAEVSGEARQVVTISAKGFENKPLVIPVVATFAGKGGASVIDNGVGCTISPPRQRALAPSPSVQ